MPCPRRQLRLSSVGEPSSAYPPAPRGGDRCRSPSDVQVQIEKLVYGGRGLGRVDGRVALVPFVAPGEIVEVEAVRQKKGLIEGRVVGWVSKSSDRVEPSCPVFGVCGGCHYQHLSYDRQLEAKRQILLETLARVGKITWDGPVETVAGEPWGYRNRTQLRVAKRDRIAQVGFFEAGSHRLVAAASCPVNSPLLNRAHQTLRGMAQQRRFPNFLREVEFFTNETDVQLNVLSSDRPLAKSFFEWCGEKIEGFAPTDTIDYPVGDDLFRVGSRSFFQVNRFLVNELAKVVAGDASGRFALDLYAGVGLLTLPLARQFERVVAVDASRRAMRDLRFNLERAKADAQVVNLNVAEFLPSLIDPVDCVVADPPRAGLGPEVTTELVRLRPARLVLVSCDPPTLARDLSPLLAGGYRIQSMTLVDLFPQTFHLEAVVCLTAE